MAAGQNTADLAVTAVNLNTATVKDGAGNAANLTGAVTNPAGTLQIDTTAPTVTAIAETPSSGDLNAGKVVTLTLNLSEAVTVAGGTPTLTLNDGGTATYTGGSGTSALTFSYTVLAGQNTPDLMTTAVNLNGATIKDGAGNAANLSLSGITQGSPQIDTTAPSTPTGLVGTAVNSSQVNLSWTASTDNAGVTGYEIFRNGTLVGTSATNSYSDTGLTASTQYAYTVEAYDAAGNVSAQSATTSATTPGAWSNVSFPTQTTNFTASFDATPSQSGADIVIGLGPTAAAAYTDLAAIVRFNSSNTIDVRNGSGYGADVSVPYSAGTDYHFRMVVNVATDTYSVYVTPQGGSEIELAANYAFRTEQATDTSLSDLAESATARLGGRVQLLHRGNAGDHLCRSVTLKRRSQRRACRHADAEPERGGDGGGRHADLTLNDGGTATYTGGSGTNALTFSYTVAAGQNTSDLAATAVNLNCSDHHRMAPAMPPTCR